MNTKSFNSQLSINYEDSLTNIGNAKFFLKQLENIWHNCLEFNTAFSLILCNIKHFKSYNDIYGHEDGDRTLIKIANILQNSVKEVVNITA